MTDKPEVITRMLDFFKVSSEAESDNRKRGLDALKFRSGGDYQWDTNILNLRSTDNRPCESYNQIPQFVHQVTNDMRMNMPQIRYIPGNDGSKEIAEIYEDLVRAIQSSSEGEVAYDAAADSQVTIGWGYWRYVTEYENNNSFDQVIKYRWIPNPFMVYDDPYAVKQDRSDRKQLLEVSDVDVKAFNKEYGKQYSAIELTSIGNNQPDWATDETVRIAEYWEVTERKGKLYRQGTKITREKPKGEYEEREVCDYVVTWYKCTALEVLEQKEWPGAYIPYVKVVGEELNVDGKVVLSGLVEHMMAPQKQYNYWSNAATEMVALAPKAPYLMALGQVEGLEKIWDNANTRNYPYLPYKPVAVNGTVIGPPQRNQNSADIASMLTLVQQAQQNFYTTTGIYPASLGKASNETSGKAIMARQREGDVSTFHFSDNMARAMRCGGRILADLIPKIYDGSRVLRLLKEDKTHREVKVNQQYLDEQKGEPVNYDLTIGTYDVMVTTGPSFTTKRQEASEAMLQLAAQTNLMEVAPDLFYANQDWPGASEISERYKRTLPPQLTAPEGKKGEIPPQVAMQMQQMEQALQQLSAQLEQAQAELQSKQGDLQLKQADLELKAQQMQLEAQDAQRQAELDMAQKQLDAQKLELEQQKIELDAKKLEVEMLKIQMGQAQQAQTPVQQNSGAEVILQDKNLIAAHLMSMEQREMAEMQQREMEKIQEQQEKEQEAIKEQMEAEQEAQQAAAMMQQLAGIQQSIGLLTQSIMAPKKIVRDPATGMVQGVVTEA